MNNHSWKTYVNVALILITIVFNILANALPLNGLSTGEISDRFEVYFVPAGYVFSIWGVIYISWVGFAYYQLLPAQRDNARLERIGYLFVLSCLANMAWLYLWHHEHFVLTLVAMFALLVLLIVIYLRLQIGTVHVTTLERWCVDVPFSLYLGWITVATIANVTSVLYYLEWGGWGVSPELWTLIMLVAGVGIASAMSLTRGDVAYLLVLIWAFAGIAVKHAGVPVVAAGAWAATVLVAVMLAVGVVLAKRRGPVLNTPA